AQVRAEAAQQLAEEARARTEVLAEAGRRTAVSLDYEWTLQQDAELAVTGVAGWCGRTQAEAAGSARSVAGARSGSCGTGSAPAPGRPAAAAAARDRPPRGGGALPSGR